MKVTFIYPDLLLHRPDWGGYFYVGVASLSAVLKRHGYTVSLIHITRPIDKSDFIARVAKENPDLIGLSSTSPLFPFVKEYVSWLEESKMKVPTICGGIHPTIAPDETIEVRGIDMICRGEGEDAMLELCQRIERKADISDIRNLWIKKNDVITKNPLRPVLDDLDKLPFPDRSIFDYRNLYTEREGKLSFLVSRGCPYKCTYCCNHLISEIYGTKGKPIRFRSVDSIIAEIKEVVEHYPFLHTVNFDDDILFLRREWAEEFAEKYSKQINLPFICNARANLATEVLVSLLKKAGCCHVKFGLESGNEYISNKILNRHLTNEQVKKAFALCKKAGLTTESFNMVGIPYDTPSTILDTIKLNAAIGVDKMQVSVYQPYHATALANLCLEQGFIVPKELEPDWFSPTMELGTVSRSQVLMFRDYFKILVRYYQIIQRLRGRALEIAVKLSDKFFSSIVVSKLFNAAYIPMNSVLRSGQVLRSRVKAVQGRRYRRCDKSSTKE
jgi:anaerobic magnesium-protoporphyrin IX monomethyl ester cyclase